MEKGKMYALLLTFPGVREGVKFLGAAAAAAAVRRSKGTAG